jgi:oligopeptide transport system substrate-binding protein
MRILAGLLSVLIGACAPAAPQRSEQGSGDLAAEQVFRFAANEPTTIDPGLTGDFTTLQYFQLLGEGLVGYDQAGKIRMLGAESYDVSSDGTVFTFKLRPGAKFSDGSPVTAHDYVWTMKRNLDPASGSKYAQSLYPITGAQAFNRGEVADRDAVGVTALDDYTLRITTTSPAAYFLPLAATSWTMYPLKRDVLERYGEKWTEAEHYVGNGPFTIQSWKHDQEMVLVPNPHYWGPRPVLQQVVIKLTADPGGQSLVGYEKGELDFANVPSTDVERVQRDPVLSKETRRVAISADRWVSFDNANPPFQDVRVRKAFYLAIDREALANVIFRGVPVPAWTVLPPTVDGHNPGARIAGGPDDARRLLAEAGYPEGRGLAEIELVGPTQTEFRLIAQGLQEMWKTVLGVGTKINLMEPNTFVNWRRARKEQPYQAYIGGWANDYNDPYNWHNFLFDSRSDYYNLHYANPTFDELVARGAGELDTARRKQLYEQAEALFVGEAPVAPLYYRAYLVAVKPYVDGLVYTPDLGMLRLDWTRILAH